jgi:hypothetical protein
MTRKHFQLIADTIDGLIEDGTLDPHTALLLSSRFAYALQLTNTRFDRERFLTAARKSLAAVEEQFEKDMA